MDIEEALNFTDHLALTTTGKHLDSLQKAILRGAWNSQKYKEIAQEQNRSEKYVKEVGFKLWKLLSVALGEEQVSKANFRATLENLRFGNISLFGNGCIHIRNISADTFYSPKASQSEPQYNDEFNEKTSNSQPKVRQDLSDAPDHKLFDNRTSELSTLKQWILENRTRVVTILGLTGIGKTTIALQLIPQIQDQFDYVIWRSLHNAPPLETLQTNLIQFLCRDGESAIAPSPEERATTGELPQKERATTGGLPLPEYLRSRRCLIILDDVQMIFSNGKLAGNYQPGYENYGTFFKQIAESSHNSCLIILSWEKPKEIAVLKSQNQACKTLKINGLVVNEAEEIFREKGLSEPENWSELINLYRGNPSWLNIVAAMIQDLFSGSISQFLLYKTLILGDLESLLQQHFHRLSDSEKKVIFSLATQGEPMEISQIATALELSPPALLQALESLGRRLLIEKVKQDEKTLFTLQPVLMEYVKNQ
jgi:DNA-binding transcriptional ArsR family regulator/ABC-type dipeptide/oligopeptide/nickel transport system ATPase subunit